MSNLVDSKLPRSKAFVHALLPAISYVAGPPWGIYLLGLTAVAMGASVLGGPKYSLIGRVVSLVRRGIHSAPGTPEAAAPHRFAEAVGAVMVAVAAILYAVGAEVAGAIVTLAVAGLAAVNAFAGICVGCQMYLIAQKLRSRLVRREAWS